MVTSDGRRPPLLILALALIATIELARRLPLLESFRRMAALSARLPRLLRPRCSDHWRERALRLASAQLFLRSSRAGLLLALAVVPVGVAILLDRRWSLGVVDALAHWHSRAVVAAGTISYAIIRHATRRRLFAR